MTKFFVRVGVLTFALAVVPHILHAQKKPGDDQRRSEAANEPMQAGAAAQRDAAAIRDANAGWYGQALKMRDARLAWWRDARYTS